MKILLYLPKLLIAQFIILSITFFNVNCSEKESSLASTGSGKPTYAENKPIQIDTVIGNTEADEAETGLVQLVFIGTYTWGTSKGIYVYKLDTATGSLSYLSESPNTSNPSYLVVHPNKQWVYAVNENSTGTITSFDFDTITSEITYKNSVSSQGNAPCYINIDNSGKYVLVANYNSGNITVCPINNDGTLDVSSSTNQHTGSGPVSGRQDSPHAHMIIQSSNNFIYSTDLGIDKILVYNLDTISGVISTVGSDVATIPGSGPRHIAFHPFHPWAYTLCELSGTIESYTIDNTNGALNRYDTISTLPAGVTAAAASADIHITPDGKYLYASNRGSNNNIAMYSIDQISGKLTLLGHQPTGGTTPRSFAIDKTGSFLIVACQDNSKVITFRINKSTGLLISTGQQISVPNPVCVKFISIFQKQTSTGIKVFTQ